jgi:hypothetical protein
MPWRRIENPETMPTSQPTRIKTAAPDSRLARGEGGGEKNMRVLKIEDHDFVEVTNAAPKSLPGAVNTNEV